MAYILDISTAVPDYTIEGEDCVKFFASTLEHPSAEKLVRFLNSKTQIKKRYSCIPDYQNNERELYTELNPSIELRMELYKQKIVPLASKAIDDVLFKNGIESDKITHLITVSCTGIMAPGFELFVAEKYNLLHTEKLAINFMGCYAGLKALKHANFIANSEPNACVLIISAELCSLHFHPSQDNEDVISNLLFGDGAAAVLVCGEKFPELSKRKTLSIDSVGSGFVPESTDLMSWNISSTAFKMHLSTKVVDALREYVKGTIENYIPNTDSIEHWAIHPGGIKIIEAVKDAYDLKPEQIEDSMHVLREYGNMSSCSVLFILQRILNKSVLGDKSFSIAFGPGITVEMISLTTTEQSQNSKNDNFPTEIAPQRAA
jgi:alpha-pyrone synthase